MEFRFNINEILPTELVVVNSSQNYLRLKRIDSYRPDVTQGEKYSCSEFSNIPDQMFKLTQERLSRCIDVMGQKSAQAQGLKEPITSAVKIIRSDHRLYMIKDALANNGNGALIGILKVGKKKLFLTNDDGDQAEVTPVCLLDFYVDESRQRQGYGLRLFKVMLELEGITPVHLAIDKPSTYLLCFLKKHYKLDRPQFHPNKYVVFPGFPKSVKGDTLDKGTDKQTKSRENYEQTGHQFVALHRNERLQNSHSPSSAFNDVAYAPLTSPAAAKSFQRTAVPAGRYVNDRRWQQMYDSWNVIGVPPRDYSYLKNERHPPLRGRSSFYGRTALSCVVMARISHDPWFLTNEQKPRSPHY